MAWDDRLVQSAEHPKRDAGGQIHQQQIGLVKLQLSSQIFHPRAIGNQIETLDIAQYPGQSLGQNWLIATEKYGRHEKELTILRGINLILFL